MKGEYHPCAKWPTNYTVDDETGCWVWQGGHTPRGYGYAKHNGKKRGAHRIFWEEANGPIPEGLEIDHLCDNPGCVNPAHMRVTTHRENWKRSNCPSAVNARKTHCPAGHPYNDTNTHVSKTGKRYCRVCDARRQREYRAKRRTLCLTEVM